MGFSRQEYWSGLPFPSPGKDTFNMYKYNRRYQRQWIDDRFVKCICRYTNSDDSLKSIGHKEYIESELTWKHNSIEFWTKAINRKFLESQNHVIKSLNSQLIESEDRKGNERCKEVKNKEKNKHWTKNFPKRLIWTSVYEIFNGCEYMCKIFRK